ncbi:hypothetical protein B0H66DRAFT_241863 [Apodospora peruviana]|uniref:Uncharacterized protein n=1 Tax=Apodospora peruviana TaxID=516989 RepID=A0AAE0M4L2_9PEZI|nr:hypothetical protein B0H66DRAFT_241863 [Apodospora peruviana]
MHERLPPEDVLMDLITVTDLSRDLIGDSLHGLKRPRDDRELTEEEPSPKRDRLGEELEEMVAAQHETRDSTPGNPAQEELDSLSSPSTTDGRVVSSAGAGVGAVGGRRVLPMRHARRQSSQGSTVRNHEPPAGPSSSLNSPNSDTRLRLRSRQDTRPR